MYTTALKSKLIKFNNFETLKNILVQLNLKKVNFNIINFKFYNKIYNYSKINFFITNIILKKDLLQTLLILFKNYYNFFIILNLYYVTKFNYLKKCNKLLRH